MMPPFLTVFSKAFLTRNNVDIGRLVTNPADPGQNFWPKSIPAVANAYVDEAPFESVDFQKRVKFKDWVGSIDRIITQEWKSYSLLQQLEQFEGLCRDKAGREWMEKMLIRNSLFYVVGLVTVKDANVTRNSHESDCLEDSSGGEPPTPRPFTSDVCSQIQKSATSSCFVPGERVIAIRYTKVRFSLFWSKNVDSAYMDKGSRWEMFLWGDREGQEDSIEACLQDSTEIQDLDLDDVLEGDMTVVEDEDFVFLDE
jgi:hypothetical protein